MPLPRRRFVRLATVASVTAALARALPNPIRAAQPNLAPAGRFRIAGGPIGDTEETDGIALASGRFSRIYPDGLFVAQDGNNAPDAQNFKLASWAEILKAVRAAAP